MLAHRWLASSSSEQALMHAPAAQQHKGEARCAHLRASTAQRFIISLDTTKGAQGARLMRHMLNLLASWKVSISLMQSAYTASSSSTSVSGGRPPGGGGRGQQVSMQAVQQASRWLQVGKQFDMRRVELQPLGGSRVQRRVPSRVAPTQYATGHLCPVAYGTRHVQQHPSRAAAAGAINPRASNTHLAASPVPAVRAPLLSPLLMIPRVGWKRMPISLAARMLWSRVTSLGYRYRWSLEVVQPDMSSSAIASLEAMYTSSPCRGVASRWQMG
jgi:hypothetical protein